MVALGRWLFYAVRGIWELAWADSALVILDKWSSYRGGCLSRFNCVYIINIRYFQGRNFHKNMFCDFVANSRKCLFQKIKLILNRGNIFCEIKFLICIHKIPFMKFVIFKMQFAKVSSLEKYILTKIHSLKVLLFKQIARARALNNIENIT